ncbi:hypothetical protein [Nonomuraea sp. NPDC049758]|uniref:hypothetical protein n=1 Tax=Nonomuraea sp. NPDC049758 TaxID=3154360 RepID=UPI00343ACDB9
MGRSEHEEFLRDVMRECGWREAEIRLHRVVRAGPILSPGSPAAISYQGAAATRRMMAGFTEVISARGSHRLFGAQPVLLGELLHVMRTAMMTSARRPAYALPGGVRAVEPLLLVDRVVDDIGRSLPEGVYSIDADRRLANCELKMPFAEAARTVDTYDVRDPAVLVLLCLHLERYRHYDNAYELGLLEAGELLHSLALSCAQTGLGACVLGSVFDEPLWSVLAPLQELKTTIKKYGAPLAAVAVGEKLMESR